MKPAQALTALLCSAAPLGAAELFLEAESFTGHGSWKLDTQFIDEMGSPYLLAHGLGRPVDDATTAVTFPEAGSYHVFVRTKDWTARWDAEGSPGQFKVKIGDALLEPTFGTEGKDWMWQSGGKVEIAKADTTVALHDLTGFNGRCDALYFTTDGKAPPAADAALAEWRRKQLGLPDSPAVEGPYDLVVVGGGYSGMGAAISASRAGCKVALIQNRPVLGSNGSSEVRVWAKGNIRRGKFPRIGEIIEEISDSAKKHKNAILTWVAYIGGPRESRRLLGDVQLTEEAIVAKKKGMWQAGTGLAGFIGECYLYAGNNSGSTFTYTPKENGRLEVRLAYLNHENRGKTVPVAVSSGGQTLQLKVDMTKPAPIEGKFFPLGKVEAKAGSPISITVSSAGAGGNAHADAVQFLPAK